MTREELWNNQNNANEQRRTKESHQAGEVSERQIDEQTRVLQAAEIVTSNSK